MATEHLILYAEDDIDDLLIVNEAFEKHENVQIVHAQNGWEAMRILRTLQVKGTLPCLIILDINMPGVDGKEALKQIKMSEELKKIPVVLFSTSSSLSDKEFAQKWGAELITKPFVYNDLENLANEFVKRCDFEISNRA